MSGNDKKNWEYSPKTWKRWGSHTCYWPHDIFKHLVEAGADIHYINADRYNAIMFCAQNGHIEILKILLEAGADIHPVDNSGYNAIMFCAQNGHIEIL